MEERERGDAVRRSVDEIGGAKQSIGHYLASKNVFRHYIVSIRYVASIVFCYALLDLV